MTRRKTWTLLFGGALLLRILVVFAFPVPPTADAADYDAIARSLIVGEGFPGAFRPPLYPIFVAGVYGVFGGRTGAVYILQALLDAVTCLILAVWALRRFGESTALWTLVFAGLSMSALASVRILLSECLATFLLTASLVSFDELTRSELKPWRLVWPGVFLGLLTLTRGIMLLFPFTLLPFLCFRGASTRTKLAGAMFFIASYGLALSPWLVRNSNAVGAPVLTTQVGITFYSSHFRNDGQPYGVLTDDAVTREASQLSAAAGSRYLSAYTLERLWTEPGIVLSAYPFKLLSLWAPFDWEVLGGGRLNVTYLLTLLFAGVGSMRVLRRDLRTAALVLMPLLYLSLMAFPFYGSPRFRLPAELMLAPLAACGLASVVRRSKLRQSERRANPL